jgi:OOP family OmpA-OmpF porin
MRSHLSSRALRRAVIFLVASLSIGCGTVRNPSLERARDAYQKARQDPLIVRNAGAALDRAQSTLETAEQLWAKERDVNEVEHLAYIAEKRVEIARVTAERRQAAEELKQGGGRP